MNVPEILERKRDGLECTSEEISALVRGLLDGSVPEYQIAAWLMAVLFRGMTSRETADLTSTMLHSGDVLSWDDLSGATVDKHSTGGVGDKISIPLAPAVAACGAWIPMISGRGLGHTGGTLDKLESIPGLRTNLEVAELRRIVRDHGFAIAGASARLAPADAKLYALRDVTGTVPSIPLITASILSKKLAAGISGLVLDVKTGSGAFLRTESESRALAASLVGVARALGRNAVAFLTRMDEPLGHAVGNALEIRESIDVLEGKGPADVVELVVVLGGAMLEESGVETQADAARERVRRALESGAARERFAAWVQAQGGDARALEERGRGLPGAPVVRPVKAMRRGRDRSDRCPRDRLCRERARGGAHEDRRCHRSARRIRDEGANRRRDRRGRHSRGGPRRERGRGRCGVGAPGGGDAHRRRRNEAASPRPRAGHGLRQRRRRAFTCRRNVQLL